MDNLTILIAIAIVLLLVVVGLMLFKKSADQGLRHQTRSNQGPPLQTNPSPPSQSAASDQDNPEPDTDSEVERDRFGRMFQSIAIAIATLVGPPLLLLYVFGSIGPIAAQLSVVIGICAGIEILCGYLMPKITANTPLYQGLMTYNFFGGKPAIFGPGLRFKYLTDIVHRKSHFSLEDVTKVVSKHTVPAKDGQVTLSFAFTYKPKLAHLDIFGGRGESTVTLQFESTLMKFFTQSINLLNGDTILKGVDYLSMLAKCSFEGSKNLPSELTDLSNYAPEVRAAIREIQEKVGTPETIRKRYGVTYKSQEEHNGVDLTNVALRDVDFSKKAQDAKNTRLITEELKRAAMVILGLDPENTEDHKTYRDLDKKTRDDAIIAAQLAAGMQGVSNHRQTNTHVFEGNAPVNFVMGNPSNLGNQGGGKGRK